LSPVEPLAVERRRPVPGVVEDGHLRRYGDRSIPRGIPHARPYERGDNRRNGGSPPHVNRADPTRPGGYGEA
jgi:hypothetical protein